ncbi:MAG: BACON domain-containing protein [Prevotella sp.]|nr:BACON domain-containing protein [Prevotella sp.]
MKKYLWHCVAAVLMAACGGDGDGPGTDRPVISTDFMNVPPNLQLLGDGQETELRISANCNWSISYFALWLTVTPSSGSNTATVKVSAGKNSTGAERSATLAIRGGNAPERSVVVTQSKGSEEPVAKTLATNTTSLSFEAKGETKSFTISSNTSWTVSKPDWCTLSVSSGTGNGEVTVTAAENTVKEQRTGQIIITGEGVNSVSIALTQKAKETSNSEEPGAGDNQPPQ